MLTLYRCVNQALLHRVEDAYNNVVTVYTSPTFCPCLKPARVVELRE